MNCRQQRLSHWIKQQFGNDIGKLELLVGDASFRRYFRFNCREQSFIAMDSPPNLEDPRLFVKVTQAYQQLGLQVPNILYADLEQGFLVITDFGNQLYHSSLDKHNVDQFYKSALDDLLIVQTCCEVAGEDLPLFGKENLTTELNYFKEWFIERLLDIELTTGQLQQLTKVFDILVDNAISQPQVGIHRDYHSRNLMWVNQRVGLLDYQGASIGPITYDVASLLRDCYIGWPAEQVEQWLNYFYQRLIVNQRIYPEVNFELFRRWFDLMGIQRHVKAIFIFARKALRDGDEFYLQFIPRALSYVQAVIVHYPELKDFSVLLGEALLPAWEKL